MSSENGTVLSVNQTENTESEARLTRSKASEGNVELKLKPLRMPLDELVNDEEDEDYNPNEEDEEAENEEDLTVNESMKEDDVNVSQLEAEASAPLRFDVAPEMLRTKTPEYVEFVQKVFKEKLDETNENEEDPDYNETVEEDNEIDVENDDEGEDQIEVDEDASGDEYADESQEEVDVSMEIPKEEVEELHNDALWTELGRLGKKTIGERDDWGKRRLGKSTIGETEKYYFSSMQMSKLG
ncbi:unnamed protein product [Bursaphelenchus xylophilus]|uniref:(pine wood nematode) hypothetical protein n=1 Tax=Bursaphelenchus xylophilus TaxID=6326 RepID=A0A811L4P3_BURXY|nr:unnamed protein product [Bursaphelenchus xylophilus]CAG9109278.1 unnamed protein product [Bursaphelenchus xylophilus]